MTRVQPGLYGDDSIIDRFHHIGGLGHLVCRVERQRRPHACGKVNRLIRKANRKTPAMASGAT